MEVRAIYRRSPESLETMIARWTDCGLNSARSRTVVRMKSAWLAFECGRAIGREGLDVRPHGAVTHDRHITCLACLRTFCKVGIKIAISRAMIEMTTSSSVSVNARSSALDGS